MPMLISEKTALKKAKKLRHAEYYDMSEIFDKLYADSVNGKVSLHFPVGITLYIIDLQVIKRIGG